MPILHSKRQGAYYLEHCRVMVKDGRVVYLTDEKNSTEYFWNLPIGNTTILLLGNGTSLTQAAARLLAEEGVMVGFVGGGGSPLFLASQSEYRPTEYLQAWLGFWPDETQRLLAAKWFQRSRCDFVLEAWGRLEALKAKGLLPEDEVEQFRREINHAQTGQDLMAAEGRYTKRLYARLARAFKMPDFRREQGKKSFDDPTNSYLDHGNYLAYGLAACALWVLGIPHSLPLSHGMTRRGALVFDVADLVKDGIVLPMAFICASKGKGDQEFRDLCVRELRELKALERMIEQIQELIKASGAWRA
jgi:CRISPR-associated protein Cas1